MFCTSTLYKKTNRPFTTNTIKGYINGPVVIHDLITIFFNIWNLTIEGFRYKGSYLLMELLRKNVGVFFGNLNDDEDVNSVAALAVKLISKTFEEYLWKKTVFKDREKEKRKGRGRPKKWDKKDNYLRIPYFSNEAYNKLCEAYNGERKKIEEWIEKLETNEIIRKENLYEKCYRLNIDSKVFIHDYVKNSSNDENIESPFIIVKQKKKKLN